MTIRVIYDIRYWLLWAAFFINGAMLLAKINMANRQPKMILTWYRPCLPMRNDCQRTAVYNSSC